MSAETVFNIIVIGLAIYPIFHMLVIDPWRRP